MIRGLAVRFSRGAVDGTRSLTEEKTRVNRRNSLSIRRLASIAIIAGAAAFLAPASAFAYQSLKVTKSVDRATAPIGDTLTYTIVVSDDGSKFPTNPGTITDTLPPQLTYVSGGPNCSVAGQVVTCAVPKIGAGEVASVTYTIKATINPGVAPGTVITNNVKLSVPFDETSNNNDASAMTTTVTQGLGNYVWIDANGNGLQDDACTIPGVTVTLKDASGKAIGTTKTDANCQYRFDNLQYDTTYQVCVDSPADYAPGGPLSGTTVKIGRASCRERV